MKISPAWKTLWTCYKPELVVVGLILVLLLVGFSATVRGQEIGDRVQSPAKPGTESGGYYPTSPWSAHAAWPGSWPALAGFGAPGSADLGEPVPPQTMERVAPPHDLGVRPWWRPTGIDVVMASYHTSAPLAGGHWCQVNPGLGLEYNRWTVVGYHSSLCRPVEALVYVLPLARFAGLGDLQTFVEGGVAHGYRIPAVAALGASWRGWTVVAMPLVTGVQGEHLTGVAFGLVYRFAM